MDAMEWDMICFQSAPSATKRTGPTQESLVYDTRVELRRSGQIPVETAKNTGCLNPWKWWGKEDIQYQPGVTRRGAELGG